MEIYNLVCEVLKGLCGVEEINLDDALQEDIGLDSLLMVTLLVELEEAFEIELEESDMNPYDLLTVEDVLTLVKKYCGDKYEES